MKRRSLPPSPSHSPRSLRRASFRGPLQRGLAAGSLLLSLGSPEKSDAAPTKADGPISMEQKIAKLAELFKPIPDAEWSTVSGQKSSETYETVKGDTLYGISKRLFNDPKYWPKIWSLNNSSILNPHRITPGVKIAFLPGSGSSLPGVSIQSTPPETSEASANKTEKPSETPPAQTGAEAPPAAKTEAPAAATSPAGVGVPEWKQLPRQRWETLTTRRVGKAGSDGLAEAIQKNLVLNRPYNFTVLTASEKIQPLAEVVGSREPAIFISDQNTAFIEAEKALEIGKTYSVLAGTPTKVTHSRSDRTGYSYSVAGRMTIEGVRDGIYLGRVDRTSLPIERGYLLVPEIKTIEFPRPVAAAKTLVATVIPNVLNADKVPGQYQEVFLDRGTVDGVQVGSVFRVHRHFDPLTERRISDADFMVEADILVIQTSEEHSLGIITQGHANILAGDDATLLTDISDVGIHLPRLRLKGGGNEIENELDKLDQEGAAGLKKDEKRELEQLEEWKKNPPQPKPEAPTEAPPATETPPSAPVEDSALDSPATQGTTPAEAPKPATTGPSAPTEVPAEGAASAPAPAPTPAPVAPPQSLPAPPSEVPEGANDLIPPGG